MLIRSALGSGHSDSAGLSGCEAGSWLSGGFAEDLGESVKCSEV